MQTSIKVVIVIISSLCLSIFTGKLCAWNGTSLLPQNQHYFHPGTAENDSSSSFYYGGDEVPDIWPKPRGGFAGALGEMLITLPLFNRMDREAAMQRSYIIGWPVNEGKNKQEVSGGDKFHEEKPDQTTASVEYTGDRQTIIQKPDEEQPPEEDLDHHTHIDEGEHCYASGCNGGRCQCSSCEQDDASTDTLATEEGENRRENRQNIIQLLWQRQSEGRQLNSRWLGGFSQQRLRLNIQKPERTHPVSVLAVLDDGRLAIRGEQPEDLRIWHPMKSSANYSQLTGHTAYIIEAITLRDGRLLTWSKDQTVRIWSEQASGEWSSTAFTTNIDRIYKVKELIDGSLMTFDRIKKLTTIWLENNQKWAPEMTIEGFVEELKDGRLYLRTDNSLTVWTKYNTGWHISATIDGTFEYLWQLQVLEGGSIITMTSEGDGIGLTAQELSTSLEATHHQPGEITNRYFVDLAFELRLLAMKHSYLRVWEENDTGWVSTTIDTGSKYRISGLLVMDGDKFLRWNDKSLQVWEKIEGNWISSTLVENVEGLQQPVILNRGAILTFGATRKVTLAPTVWSQFDNTYQSQILTNDDGYFILIDKVLLLKDGRWISWNNRWGELRIWSDWQHQGFWTSTVLLKGEPDHRGYHSIAELPGGWLIVVRSTTLRLLNLFPSPGYH